MFKKKKENTQDNMGFLLTALNLLYLNKNKLFLFIKS